MNRFAYAPMTSLVLLASCGESSRAVEVTLLDPCLLGSETSCDDLTAGPSEEAICGGAFCSKSAVWTQLAVFPNGCPSDDVLRTGDIAAALRVISADAGGNLPEIGELDEARFGFAGLLRGSDCAVFGAGCTEADLTKIRKVRVEMLPVPRSGACQANDICREGSCVDAEQADGESCLPLLVASGDLPQPSRPGAAVSGPGIVATDRGYLIGYREDSRSTDGSSASIRLLPLGDEGVLGPAVDQPLEACEKAIPKGGIGMAMALDQGLLATEYPACDGRGAGAAFVAFAPNGAILDVTTFTGDLPEVSLASAHSLAPGPSRNSFELVYSTAKTAHRVSLLGASPQGGYSAIFPDTRFDSARVATSKNAIAYLLTPAERGGEMLLGFSEWGEAPRVMKLPAGSVGAVSLHVERAVATNILESGGLSWTGYSTSGSSFGAGRFQLGAPFTAVDVAIADEQVVIAAGRPGEISLASIGNVTTNLTARPTVIAQFENDLGNVSLSAYAGRSLAVTSKRDRFALAWLNGNSQPGEGPVGGFAIFECVAPSSPRPVDGSTSGLGSSHSLALAQTASPL